AAGVRVPCFRPNLGENEAARDQFAAAMRIDPADSHAAGDPASRATAENAFQNIDRPLTELSAGRRRSSWAPASFAAHHDLAELAEQREDLELAATRVPAPYCAGMFRRSSSASSKCATRQSIISGGSKRSKKRLLPPGRNLGVREGRGELVRQS